MFLVIFNRNAAKTANGPVNPTEEAAGGPRSSLGEKRPALPLRRGFLSKRESEKDCFSQQAMIPSGKRGMTAARDGQDESRPRAAALRKGKEYGDVVGRISQGDEAGPEGREGGSGPGREPGAAGAAGGSGRSGGAAGKSGHCGDPGGAAGRYLQSAAGGCLLSQLLPYSPGEQRVCPEVGLPVSVPSQRGHPGPHQGGGVSPPLLCGGGPQAGQRAEVFRGHHRSRGGHPPHPQILRGPGGGGLLRVFGLLPHDRSPISGVPQARGIRGAAGDHRPHQSGGLERRGDLHLPFPLLHVPQRLLPAEQQRAGGPVGILPGVSEDLRLPGLQGEDVHPNRPGAGKNPPGDPQPHRQRWHRPGAGRRGEEASHHPAHHRQALRRLPPRQHGPGLRVGLRPRVWPFYYGEQYAGPGADFVL